MFIANKGGFILLDACIAMLVVIGLVSIVCTSIINHHTLQEKAIQQLEQINFDYEMQVLQYAPS